MSPSEIDGLELEVQAPDVDNPDNLQAPSTVQAVPRLESDLEALARLMSGESPPKRLIRAKTILQLLSTVLEMRLVQGLGRQSPLKGSVRFGAVGCGNTQSPRKHRQITGS